LELFFAYKAGYDVEEGAKFFIDMWKKEIEEKQKLLLKGQIDKYMQISLEEMFFADHPPLPERIKLINQTKRVLDGKEN
jgi:Zn-dependent protease with chaperone function